MQKMSEIRKISASSGVAAQLGMGAAKGLIAGAGSIGALALGSAMANVLEQKIQRGMSNLNKGKHYKNMLAENSIKDGIPAQRAFRTLNNFSPRMAADPMVAGTFVRRVVDYDEMIDPSQIKQLVDIENGQTKTLGAIPAAFAGGFGKGFGSPDVFGEKEASRRFARVLRDREDNSESFNRRLRF
jgi:hypothetical protein